MCLPTEHPEFKRSRAQTLFSKILFPNFCNKLLGTNITSKPKTAHLFSQTPSGCVCNLLEWLRRERRRKLNKHRSRVVSLQQVRVVFMHDMGLVTINCNAMAIYCKAVWHQWGSVSLLIILWRRHSVRKSEINFAYTISIYHMIMIYTVALNCNMMMMYWLHFHKVVKFLFR